MLVPFRWTCLGSLIRPDEAFYLLPENEIQLQKFLTRCAAIRYEAQIGKALVIDYANEHTDKLNIEYFTKNKDAFTIIDVGNASEVLEEPIFPGSVSIPLPDLRNRIKEIPTNKPVVVHCASGFRVRRGVHYYRLF